VTHAGSPRATPKFWGDDVTEDACAEKIASPAVETQKIETESR